MPISLPTLSLPCCPNILLQVPNQVSYFTGHFHCNTLIIVLVDKLSFLVIVLQVALDTIYWVCVSYTSSQIDSVPHNSCTLFPKTQLRTKKNMRWFVLETVTMLCFHRTLWMCLAIES